MSAWVPIVHCAAPIPAQNTELRLRSHRRVLSWTVMSYRWQNRNIRMVTTRVIIFILLCSEWSRYQFCAYIIVCVCFFIFSDKIKFKYSFDFILSIFRRGSIGILKKESR